MDQKIKIIVYGIGPIGQSIVREALKRDRIELVGAYDIDSKKVGKDSGELCGTGRVGLAVTNQLNKILPKCDLVVLTTTSSIEEIYPQIEEVVKARKFVVSTCEELSFPWETYPELSQKIDRLAVDKNVAVLSTGVNPGFLMDSLPIFLTTACLDVKKVKVERFQNASLRRIPFQKKIGAGNTLKEFEERVKSGSIKHVGFPESIYMIAARLNWKLEKVEENIHPIMAERTVKSEAFVVEPGKVSGIRQVARGLMNGEEKIVLEMRAALEFEDPHDSISIEGNPSFRSVVEGGISGDVATVAAVLNSIPGVLRARSGLRNMTDICLTSFSSSCSM
jgi:4-hydroxy-tetrahydrodipicolinate reductase